MSVNSKMTAIADAIRGKTGKTDTLTLDQMATEIAGIETGGGSSEAAELIFETTFSVAESHTTATEATLATIAPGFTKDDVRMGNELLCVVKCTNDTDADRSYNHFKSRTQEIAIIVGNYVSASANSGIVFSDNYTQYGSSFSLYIKASGAYCATIQVQAKGHASWGYVPSGEYHFSMYKLNHAYFGLEGMNDV